MDSPTKGASHGPAHAGNNTGRPRHVVMILSKSVKEDSRVQKEAAVLQANGHRVTVVQWDRHDAAAARDETWRGLQVRRVASRPMAPAPLAIPAWWRRGLRALRDLHAADRVAVVHCHDLDTLPIGIRFARQAAVSVVFDAHEIYPMIVEAALGRTAAKAASAYERRLLRHVQIVLVVNDALADHYRTVAPGVPVHVVANLPELADRPAPPPAPDAPFTIGYAGHFHASRLFPSLVEAMGGAPGIRLKLAGKQDGAFRAVEQASRGLANVAFHGTLPAERLAAFYDDCHAVACPLDPRYPLYRVSSNIKVFEAMGAGRPVIATRGTHSGDFVQQHGIGLAVGFSTQEVLEAASWLASHPAEASEMGRTGRSMAEARYNWPAAAQALVAAYDGLRRPLTGQAAESES